MDLPRKIGSGKEYVAKQERCAYGTRDSGSIWEHCYRDCLKETEFLPGAASPCVLFHFGKNITVVVHGDGFNALGVSDD